MSEKKRKILKIIGTTVLVIGGIVVALGFLFPGMIWRKPLGVNYTATDYNNMNQKLEDIRNKISNGEKEIETSFSSAELTAYLNENKISFLPFDSGEIKVNGNNIEMSNRVNVDLLLDEILKGQYTKEELQQEIPAIGMLPNKVNLYTKFTTSIIDNVMAIDIKAISVQGVVLPSSYYNANEINNKITDLVEDAISDYNSKNNTNFDNISISENQINVKISTTK